MTCMSDCPVVVFPPDQIIDELKLMSWRVEYSLSNICLIGEKRFYVVVLCLYRVIPEFPFNYIFVQKCQILHHKM